MRKICEMKGVRAYGNDDEPVELWLNDSGRLVIVAYNEAGHCGTEVDFWDIMAWVGHAGRDVVLAHDDNPSGARRDPAGGREGT